MRKVLFICVLFAALASSVHAERWLQDIVTLETNETSITLDNRFIQPVIFDGFLFYQLPSWYTNNVAMTWASVYHPYDYIATTIHSELITNAVLEVTGLERVVVAGDRLYFTNDVPRGILLLRFRME